MSTPWTKTAGALLFDRMHEDAAIELAVFPPRGRIFVIASAGCTAFALASRGDRVTAVDLKRAQIESGAVRAGLT